MKLYNDLGRDSIVKLVFKLAIPAMLAQLINVLYGIIDRMYIGHIPDIGEIALAGVGVCAPIVTFLSSFGTLFGLGGAIIMAMHMGEDRMDKAKKVLANSFLMLIISSLVLTGVFLLIKDYLIMWFGGNAETFIYADQYLTIYTIGTFFAVMALGLNFFITAQGFPTIAMLTVAIGAVMNIVLDSIFILVFDMGVKGAAIATVIAQFISCAFVVGFLFSSKSRIRLSFGGYNIRMISKVFKLGFPPFLIIALDSVLVIVLNATLAKYGGDQGTAYVAAATIAQSFLYLVIGPLAGLSGGTQAILSYNLGAGSIERIKKAEHVIIVFGLIFMAFMMGMAWLLADIFVSMFTTDVLLSDLSAWAIKALTIGIIPLALQYAVVDGFTAMGKVGVALYLSMFRKTIYIVCALVMPIYLGAKSVFYAEGISDIAGAIMSSILFLLLFYKFLSKRGAAMNAGLDKDRKEIEIDKNAEIMQFNKQVTELNVEICQLNSEIFAKAEDNDQNESVVPKN